MFDPNAMDRLYEQEKATRVTTVVSEASVELHELIDRYDLSGTSLHHGPRGEMQRTLAAKKKKKKKKKGRMLIEVGPETADAVRAVIYLDSRSSDRNPPGAEKLLGRIEAWTPIKLREEFLGDLREDVHLRCEEGWTEKQLRRLIWWQYGWAVVGAIWKHTADFAKLAGLFKIAKLFSHRP